MKTIRQIPIKILKAQIKASKELLNYYEGKIGILLGCPLCNTVHGFGFSCVVTSFCPWNFIELSSCGEASNKFSGGEFPSTLSQLGFFVGLKRNRGWLKLRIPMLKRWIRLMRQEIKRRKKK